MIQQLLPTDDRDVKLVQVISFLDFLEERVKELEEKELMNVDVNIPVHYCLVHRKDDICNFNL